MKTKLLLTIAIVIISIGNAYSTIHVVTSGYYTFVPTNLKANVGDTVIFTLDKNHNAVQVSKASYQNKDTTSNGGFRMPFGGDTLILGNKADTLYYVCQPHAKMNMLGTIIVSAKGSSTSVENLYQQKDLLSIFPNPATDYFNANYKVYKPGTINLQIFDITGRVVKNILSTNLESGIYNNTINISSLKSGKYFVKYTSDYGASVQSLIIK